MTNKYFIVGLVLIACLAAGCGGGGGLTPPALSDTVRQMQAGDRWIYSVTGTATEGSDSIAVVGTLTKTVTGETVGISGDETARIVTWSGTVSGVGYTNTVDTKEYLFQDADGSIWTYGGEDSGDVYWIVPEGTGRNQYVWSPLAVNHEWGSHEETSEGGSFDRSLTVTEITSITVPNGLYDVYKVEGTGMFAGSPSDEELWWAPQIGAPVQQRIIAVDSVSGRTLDLTLKLISRNR